MRGPLSDGHGHVSSGSVSSRSVSSGLVLGGALLHVAPAATSWRRARNRLLPGLAGVGRRGHVALTFDDGPHPASTPAFLDELDKLGWRATFFLLGSQVERTPGLAKEIIRRGHEIGVHGMVHTSHLRRPWWWTTNDLARAVEVVADASGEAPAWFRPPYGALSASSLVAARRAGVRTVLWTTWGRDWRPVSTPENVAATVAATECDGPTVLLHDSDVSAAPGCWRSALGALPILAERWEHAGWQVGSLSEHGL